MKEMESGYFENDIMDDDLADALERENAAILEIELEMERSDVPLECGMSPDEIIIPAPISHVFWKQIMKGDFLDAIYNCPFEMHELVTDEDISRAIFALKDGQKELLYQLAIKRYSCRMIAVFREQTDRNIRKIRDTMLKKLRKSFMPALQSRVDNHISLTKQKQIFYDTYLTQITDKKNKKTKEITNTN